MPGIESSSEDDFAPRVRSRISRRRRVDLRRRRREWSSGSSESAEEPNGLAGIMGRGRVREAAQKPVHIHLKPEGRALFTNDPTQQTHHETRAQSVFPWSRTILAKTGLARRRPLLLQAAEKFLYGGLAQRSVLNYRGKQRIYWRWCRTNKVDPVRPTENDLIFFVTWRAQRVRASTVESDLSAIQSLLVEFGSRLRIPGMRLLRRTMRGISRYVRGPGEPKMALTWSMIDELVPFLPEGDEESDLVRTVTTVGSVLLARPGEILVYDEAHPRTTMRVRHVQDSARQNLTRIALFEGKGNTFRKPCWGYVPQDPEGVTWRARQDLLRLAQKRCRESGPNGFLFAYKDNTPLTVGRYLEVIRKLLSRLGYNSELFSGKSLRRGGATSLWLRGCPRRLIKLFGRWSSSAYRSYIDKALAGRVELGRWRTRPRVRDDELYAPSSDSD